MCDWYGTLRRTKLEFAALLLAWRAFALYIKEDGRCYKSKLLRQRPPSFMCTSNFGQNKKPDNLVENTKSKNLLVRRQGVEPWTPWLRVRCSTNWASDAYYIGLSAFRTQMLLYLIKNKKSSTFLFFEVFFQFNRILAIFQALNPLIMTKSFTILAS